MADSQRKTANLFDVNNIVDGGYFYPSITSNKMVASNNTAILLLPCKPNTTYTISRRNVITKRFVMCFLTSNEIYADMPIYGDVGNDTALTLTSTSTAESQYLCFYYGKTGGSDSSTPEEIQAQLAEVMINEGSTALPYEPYGWLHSLRKLTTATEAVENPLYSDGTAVTAYTIKGNTVQNGTPTPASPVEVNGVGVRTENLLDYSTFVNDYWLNNNTGLPQPYNTGGRIATTSSIDVNNVNNVTFNFTSGVENTQFMYSLFNGSTLIERVTGLSRGTTIDVSNGDTLYLCLYRTTGLPITISDVSNAMLNVGSTALPYEPYGYKIPILSGQQPTNIYLGSTQTVRQIKKIVFDGSQTIYSCVPTADSQNYCCVFRYADIGMDDIVDFDLAMAGISYPQFITDRFVAKPTSQRSLYDDISSGEYGANTMTAKNRYVIFCVSELTTSEEYTQWFTNNPTTLYYILETPQTAAVNEPLMKIGTYADTLSNVASVPTTEGANSITVDTTVQPSEFSATWTGWHDATVKEKSENLFDKDNDIEKFYVRASDGAYKSSAGNSYSAIMPCVAGTAYTITTISKTLRVGFYATKPVDGTSCIESFNNNNSSYTSRSVTYTASTNATYMAIYAYQDGDEYSDGKTLDDIYGVLMLNTGSTALPYEPYWK